MAFRLAALLVLLPLAAAEAGETPWQRAPFVSFRLISQPADASGHATWSGVQVRPDRGYKLFWRQPGKLGIAPHFDMANSLNLRDARVLWPTPRRLSFDGLAETAPGYDRETVFPIRLEADKAGGAITLNLTMDYGVCGEVCVPGRVEFSLRIAADDPPVAEVEDLLTRFRARVPPPSAAPLRARREGMAIILDIDEPAGLVAPDLFIDAGPGLDVAGPEIVLSPDRRRAHVRLPFAPLPPDGLPGRFTVVFVDGPRSYEATAYIAD